MTCLAVSANVCLPLQHLWYRGPVLSNHASLKRVYELDWGNKSDDAYCSTAHWQAYVVILVLSNPAQHFVAKTAAQSVAAAAVVAVI